MDVWELRSRAKKEIKHSLQQECAAIEETIALLKEVAELLNDISNEDGPHATFAAVCGQSATKAYRLSLAIYSLCIDGLMVEARPLLRLLFEAWQIIAYFHEEPSRTQQVIDDTLPRSAGAIAKQLQDEIHGKLKGFRDYLNDHGSHMSFEKDTLVSTLIPFNAESVKSWLCTLFSLVMQNVITAERCLAIIVTIENSFAKEIDRCMLNGLYVFGTKEK